MKKTYINPELNVVKIAPHHMLAASPDGFDGIINDSGSGGGNALSRELEEDFEDNFDDFDDLDEEDF